MENLAIPDLPPHLYPLPPKGGRGEGEGASPSERISITFAKLNK